jgi:hypothetical protein
MGVSSRIMLSNRTRLQSMHPHPAVRHIVATWSTVAASLKA